MKAFTELILSLDSAKDHIDKVSVLKRYFKSVPIKDAVWTLKILCSGFQHRIISLETLTAWSVEKSKIPNWLFEISLNTVGDICETISLILPSPKQTDNFSLKEVIESEILPLKSENEEIQKEKVWQYWSRLNYSQRFIFNKLVSGLFKNTKNKDLVLKAIADLYKLNQIELAEFICGDWEPTPEFFTKIISSKNYNTHNTHPYPFFKSSLVPENDRFDLNNFVTEWKWDGIRVQIIKRNDEMFIWSQDKDLLNNKFPDLVALRNILPDGIVIDGIVLGRNEEKFLPSEIIKKLSLKQLTKLSATIRAFDLLEFKGEDIRNLELVTRRELLINLVSDMNDKRMEISENLSITGWDEIQKFRDITREKHAEGLVLKKTDSVYNLYKSKNWIIINAVPYTVKAVLLYAQRGYSFSSSNYSSFTFGVWDKEKDNLVSFAKAEPNFSETEYIALNEFIRNNTLEKAGPVRVVKSHLLFEIAFDKIYHSSRHKAGFSIKEARIIRWIKEQTINEADSIDKLQDLI